MIRKHFIILSLSAIILSACGGGDYPPDDPATIHCPVYPPDFVGPPKPCPPKTP